MATTDTYQFTPPSYGPSPTLAIPTFITKAKDDLAATDIYKTGASVVSSFQDVVKDIKAVLPTLLQGGKAIGQYIAIFKSIANGNLNIASLAQRLTATLGGNIGALSGLLGSDVTNSILSLTKEYGPLVVKVAGTIQTIKNANFSSLYSIGQVINSVGGSATAFGLTDNNNLAATIGGIVGSAAKYGVSGTFGVLTAGLSDANALYKAATAAYPSIISSSDLSSLKSFGFSLNGLGSAVSPNVASDFSASFSYTPSASFPTADGSGMIAATPSNSGSLLSTTLQAFNQVKAGWQEVNGVVSSTLSTAQQVVGNLGLSASFNISGLLNGSSHFQSLVSAGVKSLPTSGKEYVVAGMYGSQDVGASLSASFPTTKFTVS